MIVTVQLSKVLSPAIFKILPLNGTLTKPIVDAGRAAALTKNLILSKVFVSVGAETEMIIRLQID